MSVVTTRDVNQLLRNHTGALSYAFSTLVEQAVVALGQIFGDSAPGLSPTVAMLPDYIRYGVRSLAARNLMAEGVRHRRAANLLGEESAMADPRNVLRSARDIARAVVEADAEHWRAELGAFVYQRTARDLGVTLLQDE